jgi:ribosomal protein S16
VRLKTSRTNEWIDRQGQTLTDTARRVIESNRHDFEEALDACRASAR